MMNHCVVAFTRVDLLIALFCDMVRGERKSNQNIAMKRNLDFGSSIFGRLNCWWVSVVTYYVTTHSPAIQKQH
jgi:hypothetical protein